MQLVENIQFRAQRGLTAALTILARSEYYASVSDFIRRTMIERVREAGLTIPPGASSAIARSGPPAKETTST
jgi:hypothetical protein